MPKEVEIKFAIHDLRQLERKLGQAGFRRITPFTHEMNTLYDLPGHPLRRQGALLRLRKYGPKWVITHKAKGIAGRHKSRVETETSVEDGAKMDAILHALGFRPSFLYEKQRAEWADGTGHVLLDQTPVGDFGEIEGPARWIDKTAKLLGISPADYNTKSYAEVFFDWKRRTRSSANEMTFAAVEESLGRTRR
ncbi:MAG TPA: class IV adenylate cyclase [Terriglobales bacterium]|nr:class IV adenylate cyclase [Terriglobales bacterium]